MEKYYQIHINLETPYKWGDGYTKATPYEIMSNGQALEEILKTIGFSDYNSPKNEVSTYWYNPANSFEEIYLHPMSISGTMTKSTANKIVFLLTKNNYPNTKFENIVYGDEEKKYSYNEIVKMLNKIDDSVLEFYYKKNQGHFAINEPLKYAGFFFKEYCFIPLIDSEIKNQKTFIINYLEEKTIEYGKNKEKNQK